MSSHILDTAIGGAIAIAGTIVAQCFGLFSSRLERLHKHAVLQRERLEKISDCVAECVEWSQLLLTAKSLIEIRDMHLPPGSRQMVMLSKIHFQDSGLIQATTEYMNSLVHYHVLATTSFVENNPPPGISVGQVLFLNPEKMRPIDDAQLALRNKVDDLIAHEASKYDPST